MDDSWWLRLEDLDDDQKRVINLPSDGTFLVTGPPGSGKSNLLLLRANYLTLAGRPNLLTLVFTRTLEEFFASGAAAYSFERSKISTWVRWGLRFLHQFGVEVRTAERFDDQRRQILDSLKALLANRSDWKPYDTILLDEAQDLWPEEVEILASLSRNLFAVADSRQKIYAGTDSVALLRQLAGEQNTVDLKFHYRTGLKICRVADKVGEGLPGYIRLEPSSNYNEQLFPSRVELVRRNDLVSQIETLIQQLEAQVKAYPDGLLGVVCPRNEDLNAIYNRLMETPLGKLCVKQSSTEGYVAFGGSARICLCTIHSAKGLEFRAVHLLAADTLSVFRERERNIAYVAVTRAKTSLSIYYSGSIAGYLEQAVLTANAVHSVPDLSSLFGGGR